MDGYDKIISLLDKPYIKNLITMGIDKEHYDEIFRRIFNETVIINNREIQNKNRRTLYYESNIGDWLRRKYDNNGNLIFYENSFGEWFKREYDEYGRVINYEGTLTPFPD